MTRFSIFRSQDGRPSEIGFEDFISIVKGSSIRSCASGGNFVEFGLTDDINVSLSADSDGNLNVILVSTLNEGEFPPIRLRIVDDDEPASAALVEGRIRTLRQSYAVAFLVGDGREDELQQAIERDAGIDLEELLQQEDRLFITAASSGSFWITFALKRKKAYETARDLFSTLLPEGREALVRRVQADTELKELSVDDKKLDIAIKRARGITNVIKEVEKIKDTEIREFLKDSVIKGLKGSDADDVLSLPPPSRKPGK